MMRKLKLLRCPKPKRSRHGLRIEKWKFPRFPSFRFCPIPKIENSEISEICLFFQILTVVITQNLKTTKIWTERKTGRFRYELKEKVKIYEISEFSILTYTQIENSEISEILFTSNFDTGCNSKFKNAREMSWDKN